MGKKWKEWEKERGQKMESGGWKARVGEDERWENKMGKGRGKIDERCLENKE